jgi:CubicO group peptidase (beta-lactamase class C family)
MFPDSMIALRCSTKPVVAHLILSKLFGIPSFGLDDRQNLALGIRNESTSVTLRRLLDHSLGLRSPAGPSTLMLPENILDQAIRDSLEQITDRLEFSEFTGWYVASKLAELATGTPFASLAEEYSRDVLADLNAPNLIVRNPAAWDGFAAKLRVTMFSDGQVPVPMLGERTRQSVEYVNPASGGYGSAQQLACFMEYLADPIDEDEVRHATARLMCEQSSSGHDSTLMRTCSYGVGLFTDLEHHGFGSKPSKSAVATAGLLGSSFALVDPESSVAIGFVSTQLTTDPHRVYASRVAVVDSVYKHLEL